MERKTQFLYAIIYILGISLAIFIIGRIFPRRLIFEDRFPFKSFEFEKDGRIYTKLQIAKWKDKLPNASLLIAKMLPDFMPKKKLEKGSNIEILIKETCIAESTHFAAAILGFGCVFIIDGFGGWMLSILFLLINLPFIIIQRFNRPRLIATNMMIKRRKNANEN